MRCRSLVLAAAAALVAAAALPAGAATIVIVNNDGPGEGFNDSTAASPVGGNAGTTIGQQRLIAFQRAADIWGAVLDSAVTIRIDATFDPLSCDALSAVLGSAGANTVHANFANAPLANTWYHQALANSLAGSDLATNSDLTARFNSSIDNNENCLAGTNWYYGLDHDSGTDTDLLAVLMHEFGHGLGFSTFVNASFGSELNNQRDVYEVNIFDNTVGLHWDQMTSNQRKASAVNTGNLVWTGADVTAAAPDVLGFEPAMVVESPAAIAGSYEAQAAAFGPPLDTLGVTGSVVIALDGVGTATDGCEALTNGGAVTGQIALIDRGTCNFSVKVANAQAAGALAVIVANNTTPGPAPMGGDDPTITIPSLGISLADGDTLRSNLPASVTLKLDPNQLSGADAAGRVRLYAPNPLQSGSSISHWDTVTSPNLLMEPFINADLTDDLDLTEEQMTDIGWRLLNPAVCGNGIVEAGEQCDGTSLGGATCGDLGCALGSPTCTASCTLDYAGCSDCGACDFDGQCEAGEDCTNCASDCVSGSTSGATCGNGVCEAGNGESCTSCPQDCNGQQGGNPNNRFCCGDGSGSNPVACSDSRCSTGGFSCTTTPAAGGSYCCGDGTCSGDEDSFLCALDCGSCTATELFELSCSDGVDNDCDTLVDGADTDCQSSCLGVGSSCTDGSQCCSGSCKGKAGSMTCK
ncbi:MAG TPA: PA domain-containing protein [Thermoanaerobaculia bacterium]|nr:PA domain-containing protein [Thermoanaerobaculia bacterium]